MSAPSGARRCAQLVSRRALNNRTAHARRRSRGWTRSSWCPNRTGTHETCRSPPERIAQKAFVSSHRPRTNRRRGAEFHALPAGFSAPRDFLTCASVINHRNRLNESLRRTGMRPAPGPDGGEVQHAAKDVARLRDSLVDVVCRDDGGRSRGSGPATAPRRKPSASSPRSVPRHAHCGWQLRRLHGARERLRLGRLEIGRSTSGRCASRAA